MTWAKVQGNCPLTTELLIFALVSSVIVSPVDFPESYKDALADVTGTFRVSFQPFHCAWKLSGKFSKCYPQKKASP
jgi:hypothetical protein